MVLILHSFQYPISLPCDLAVALRKKKKKVIPISPPLESGLGRAGAALADRMGWK